MEADRETSCTPPLPPTEPLLPEQLVKYRSPSVVGIEQERKNSPRAIKTAVVGSPSGVAGSVGAHKKGTDGREDKSREERGKKGQKSDDSTTRQPSKEPSNEKHNNSETGHGVKAKKKEHLESASQEEHDNGKEHHHRSRHRSRRKTRSRSKESKSATKVSPGRSSKLSDEAGSKQREGIREEDGKKKTTKSRRSRSAEESNKDERKKKRDQSRSHSRSRSRRESVRRERRSSSPTRNSTLPWSGSRERPMHQAGTTFTRDFNFSGRRNFRPYQRGGRFRGVPQRNSPFWSKAVPPRNSGTTQSSMKYTKTLPTISWRDWVQPEEQQTGGKQHKSPARKIQPITPAIAALQEYDGSDGGSTSNSDDEPKLNYSATLKSVDRDKMCNAAKTDTVPEDESGVERIIRHIKLEKKDDRDDPEVQRDDTEKETCRKTKVDCSIVKKEPLTEEDEDLSRENKTAPIEKVIAAPVNPPTKLKFSCSFLDDLSSGQLGLLPELLPSPIRPDSDNDEGPGVDRNRRGASQSPDTDDYAANWETEDLLTSPSKVTLDDEESPRRGGTPPTNHKDVPVSERPDLVPDGTNGSVEQSGDEKRANLKPRSMHEEIIPLDDLLNVQNQLKSFKSKLEEAEKRKAKLKASKGKPGASLYEGLLDGSGGLFGEKLADEYNSFMQSLTQPTPAGDGGQRERHAAVGRERKRSSSSSSSSNSSSSSSSDSSSDSSSSSASSTSSSSSSSVSGHSPDEEKELGFEANKEHEDQTTANLAASTHVDPKEGPAMVTNEKFEQPVTPPHRPKLPVIPDYLQPKGPTPTPNAAGPPQLTPTKIYNIRDDSVTNESSESLASTIKPLELDRGTPIKMKLPSKNRILPTGGASALLGRDDDEGIAPPAGEQSSEQEKKPSKTRRSSEDKLSGRHRQKRSRDRHDRKRSTSRSNRSRDRQPSGGGSPKRKPRDRDKHTSRKDRSAPSRKERSSQRHGSRSPPLNRRTRSPRGRRRSGSRSRSQSRTRYHSLSPSQRRPPSPRAGRSPVDHRRNARSRRRYSVDREWPARRSRSPPYGNRRPPSPKDAPPMAHGENQIDIITSTGASPNVHSPVTGYKKSLADSTISDAELESQKRKLGGYGGGYYGAVPPDGMLHDPATGPGGSAPSEGGDESSPKRISLDDRINIVLGMNGTVDGAKAGGKHHAHGQHMHHHHHHSPYGEYPSSHDVYQQSARNHHPGMNNYPYGVGQEQYSGSPYGSYGSRGGASAALAPTSASSGVTPYYPGSGRGPPPSWAPRSHPYQGYPMAFVGPPLTVHHRPLLPGEQYRVPFAPPGSVSDAGNSKSHVKQVGNVLEIVPSSAPLPTSGSSDGTAALTNTSTADGTGSQPPGSSANGSTTSPAEAIGSDPAQQQQQTASSALVTPKILTAEELQQRHDRRQELKKKIREEREKKRLEKKQRKERLQLEIKRLLGSKTISSSGGTVDAIGEAGAGDGSGGGGGSASSDEEFEMIKQADLLASLSRTYEKSILKTAKPPKTIGSGNTVKKSVLFADGVAPGDESSSSADETKEKSPNKQTAAKQRKRLRRQRALKVSGKKRLIDRLKLPEIEQEPEELDPELENLAAPPPPPGSPPPELQQPRCINPPVVRMIDFREGFHGIGLPLPVPSVTMGGPPPQMHLVGGTNPMGSNGGSSMPLPVPPVAMTVPPGPVPAPVPCFRNPPNMPAHHLLSSHLATQRPASPHGGVPLHHTHPPPHLYHHPAHISHGSMQGPPPPHHGYHHHPPQTALPPLPAPSTISSALITVSGKKRSANGGGAGGTTGANPIEAIVSTAGTAGTMAASVPSARSQPAIVGNSVPYEGTPPV